ncbi:putative armadillo-like helical protein [Helianthus annuus]|nr:putative armadillo-like helical protein [Helianthus annuus]
MHSTAPPPSPAETLDSTTTLLSTLLPATLSIHSFPGRWQVIRSKLATLKTLISELSYLPHWSENQLLLTLLPNLLSTLRRIQTLCDRCTDPAYTAGKLLMQSDLDMATGWLSNQLNDLDLLLRSGVLRQSNAIVLSHPDNAWAISAYGGVPILLDVCRSGSLTAQSHAIGAIRNVASVEDIRISIGEEAGVPVIVGLLISGSAAAKEKAANCVTILASSSEYFKAVIIQEKGLQKLLQLLHQSSNPDTLEHVLRAIHSLSSTDSVSRLLSASSMFISQMSGFITQGNFTLQQISVSILANLSINDGNKRAIAGCMGSLVKLMEFTKPAGLQESALKALVNLLTVKLNRKDFVKDEKNMMRLIQMLDPMNESVPKRFSVAIVHAVMTGGSNGCRKRLVDAGAQGCLQRLSEMEVAGAKKALQRLSGNRLKNIFSRSWRE